MNYAQMTALFRVEERPVEFAIASVANVLITIGATIALVVGAHKGAIGAVIGNFLGTLTVYVVLLAYRRYQLGFQFDRAPAPGDEPVRAAARPGRPRALGDQPDRPPLHQRLQGPGRGRHLLARGADRVGDRLPDDRVPARLAGVRVLDQDETAAKRTYSYVLTYLLFITCWMSLALGSLAPWIVDILAPKGNFERSADAVPLLCFATAAYSGYSVLAIGIGRMRQTQFNWVVSGIAALVNIALNIALIPHVRDDGRRGRDARRLRRALRRHVAAEPPRLPRRLPVAAHRHARGRRGRADRASRGRSTRCPSRSC